VPCREHTSKALSYGTRSQGISQFYLHTPCSSANGMNHTCLCLSEWHAFIAMYVNLNILIVSQTADNCA